MESSSRQTDLATLNSISARAAEAEFLKCCGSQNWATQMAGARPWDTVNEMIAAANRIWWKLGRQDWLDAFHSHPKIGEKKAVTPTVAEAQRWSEAEQAGIRNSAPETLRALAELNRTYEEKFGYIFIVCATGKSSEEILPILRARVGNDPEGELRVAATEQAKITELRLRKLVATSAS
ncbi:MAG TPA: 2-oxo-4-hydroxy-4-carboxy-5-ureidoimidazoline decarboxylase [Pyrinomonadaceae bacterium]|jgi:OHCU decarboxylase|nr:2-oxo-4-hydroxy-4-carboxy-5-ureidoimidazoline decarboxylase [Pyrinomonadaceae bacterium]